MNEKVTINDVIQANENAGEWCGCLLIVSELKSFGVMAGMKIPYQGTAFIRLRHEQFEVVGKAVLVEKKEDYNA